ncbi:hypothetical protein DPMN_151629 [Dreissena polymorpha]|uniref:Uncharacterized protein n=1 Tax=Dreissena polymorpha TaxID=45954 RepID=A0A9D4FFF1_DREPO|nr:hypothetical protein DPMN_151629 [Dreissena polymorpha]
MAPDPVKGSAAGNGPRFCSEDQLSLPHSHDSIEGTGSVSSRFNRGPTLSALP